MKRFLKLTAQRYHSSGGLMGPGHDEFMMPWLRDLAEHADEFPVRPRVADEGGTAFVVVYDTEWRTDADCRIFYRIADSTGNPVALRWSTPCGGEGFVVAARAKPPVPPPPYLLELAEWVDA